MFQPIGNLVEALGHAAHGKATDFAQGTASSIYKTTTASQAAMLKTMEAATKKLTPTVIDAALFQTGPQPDAYEILIDANDFLRALRDGTRVRPKLMIRAGVMPEDRELLANRLITALEPVTTQIQQEIEEIKKQKMNRIEREKLDTFWTNAAVALDFILLSLLEAGPLVFLVVGLAGLQYIQGLPKMFFNQVGKMIGLIPEHPEDSGINDLRNHLARNRDILHKVVAEADITIDPILRSVA